MKKEYQHITGYKVHSDFYNCFKCGKPLPYFELCNCYMNDIVKKYAVLTDEEICKMSDKIQIAEEQARQMAELVKIDSADSWNVRINKIIDLWKQYGYIEKTAVEEAEELWQKAINRYGKSPEKVELFELVRKQRTAIQELKKQVQLNEEAKDF